MAIQYSIQKLVSDGTLSTIVLGVQYLQRNDVYVRIAGVETPQSGAPSGYTWSFLDNNTIRVLPAVPAGVEVVVYRRTDLDAMYNIYSQNAQFDESTIDENNQQLLYIAQEYFEQGIPTQLIEDVEYVREDTANMYYRLKLSDGSYTAEFPVPKGGAAGFDALRRTYLEAGLNLVAGSFETGGVLGSTTDVLLHNVTAKAYAWSGAFPKVVDAGSIPTPLGSGGWIDRSDVVLRDQLGIVSIKDMGAVPGFDCATALINAGSSTTGAIFVPGGDFVATATPANSAAILSLLKRIKCDGTLTINLSAGEHNHTQQVVVNSPDAQRIKVLGAATVNTTITGQVSVSGAAKNWTVVLSVASSTGIAVGDYVMIRTDVAGTGDFYAHAGVWKVTAVDSGGANRISVLNTCHKAAFPVNTITGGTVAALKTVMKFTGCDAFRFEGGQPLGEFDRIAIVGDYVLATATGTQGAHGIIVSSPVITGGESSNSTFNPGGLVSLGPYVGVSGFGEQGIAVAGRGSMVANFVASCSNRKRGWYAEGASIRAKLGVGSGNGEDGYIADTSGYIQAALCIASGNGLNGFWSTNLSLVAAATSKATSNITNGYESRGQSRTGGDLCFAMNNGLDGFSASDGGMIDADSATATSNSRDGFREVNNSTIDCNNSNSTNNGAFGYNGQNMGLINASGSGTISGNASGSYNVLNDACVIGADGSIIPGTVRAATDIKILNSADNQKGARLTATSIGDLVIGNDFVGAGTFTSLYVLKADGTLHPSNDNTQILGRPANRYQQAFATSFRPGDGTPLWTSGAGSPEGAVTAVVGSMRTRTDGGANTTLYIKETGSGNTGWVAK